MNKGRRRAETAEQEKEQEKRRKDIRRAYQEFLTRLPRHSLPVTLVLRQKILTAASHWQPMMTEYEASKTLQGFLYRIDRAVFKNAARVDRWRPSLKRLQRFFVMEWGADLGLHYHGAIEIPASFSEEDFGALLDKHWRTMDHGTRIHIGWEASQRWNDYTLKAKGTGPLADHIDVLNLHFA